MKRAVIGYIMDGRSGGLDTYLLNFIETVSSQGLEIDLLTNKIDDDLNSYLRQKGVRLEEIPTLRHPAAQYRKMCALVRERKYDTAYFNISTAIDCVGAIAARKCGVNKIVIHSHASGNDCKNGLKKLVFDLIHKVCRGFLYRMGTEYYGASRTAGLWMFPEKIVDSSEFHVILSAVDKEKYSFDRALREEVRREEHVEDNFVIGHVGNFCYVKNYGFILRIFSEIYKKEKRARLLLVGDGALYEEVRRDAEELGVLPYVKFTGWRSDTERLVQAMDVFLLPSFFEGMSLVSLEAQCAKLPCVLSDTVPEETRITDVCQYVSLDKSAEEWADIVLSAGKTNRDDCRFLPVKYAYDRREQQEELRKIL